MKKNKNANFRFPGRGVGLGLIGLGFIGLFAACAPSDQSGQTEFVLASAEEKSLSRSIEVSGILAPIESANVYAKLSGLASRVTVDVGDRVKAGQVLLEIDVRELRSQLALAEASVKTVREQAAQAEISVSSAKTKLEEAQRYADRIGALKDNAALSQAQVEEAQSRLDLAKRAYDGAKLQYETLSDASLAQAEAQAEVIRSQISNSILASPIDGVVSNRNINPGELVGPGTPLFSLARIDRLKLQGTVAQDVVVFLEKDMEAAISVDGIAGTELKARISQIGPLASGNGQYFPVVFALDNPGKVMAGMSARAIVDLSTPPSVVLPLSAMLVRDGAAWVFCVDDGVVIKTPVVPGLQDGKEVQILRGVSAGQKVATGNLSLLKDHESLKNVFALK